jgi:hypothetical protein
VFLDTGGGSLSRPICVCQEKEPADDPDTP